VGRSVAHVFGEDYGTSLYKYGPGWLGGKPEIIENRGYFPRISRVISEIRGYEEKEIIVGPDVSKYLESRDELIRLYYPMRNGIVDRGDERGWIVVKELTRYGIQKFKPPLEDEKFRDFNGYYVVAALAAQAPRYMYERLIEIHREVEAKTGLIKAFTIIPQPLAVAIAEGATTCIVIEGGHGNTQVAPISRDIIRTALIPLNRGGSDSNAITRQILRDLGYSDLAREEKLVTLFKEQAGLIPITLDKAIEWCRMYPERISGKFRVPGTMVEIDMEDKVWQRFLIGEYMFNPAHEIFESYYTRGFPPPNDTVIGNRIIPGKAKLSEVIRTAVELCAVEIQAELYKHIILSGGSFSWKVPKKLSDIAVDAPTKVKIMMKELGLENVNVRMVKDPKYSVWRGTIVYGAAVPDSYGWDWNVMEGWIFFK